MSGGRFLFERASHRDGLKRLRGASGSQGKREGTRDVSPEAEISACTGETEKGDPDLL